MDEPQGDSPTPHLRVAAEVRAQLARRRVSGRQAAFALGWKQPYIARRLSGEIPFDVNDLTALADLLGLHVTEFFEVPSAREGVLEEIAALMGSDFDRLVRLRKAPTCTPVPYGAPVTHAEAVLAA